MWVIILAATWAFYAVAVSSQIDLGVHFTSNTSALPILTLPYGSWRASQYDSAQDVWAISFVETRGILVIIFLSDKREESLLTARGLDIHFQKHSLRCPSCRKLEMGETGGPAS